jgi:hypothetical protein
MPRAGSGWYYNLVHDFVVAAGGQDARRIRRQYHLERLLTEVNCNLSTLAFPRLIPVLYAARSGNQFVIKTHAGPTYMARNLIRSQWIKVIYIFRDPRAALLSAYEYGQRAVQNQRPNAFSHLANLNAAAEFINFYVQIWKDWSEIEGAMLVRYEDLLSHYAEKVEETIRFLDLQLSPQSMKEVFDQYQPGQENPHQAGTHFSHGEAERFRREISPEQLEKFTAMYAPALTLMGYTK